MEDLDTSIDQEIEKIKDRIEELNHELSQKMDLAGVQSLL